MLMRFKGIGITKQMPNKMDRREEKKNLPKNGVHNILYNEKNRILTTGKKENVIIFGFAKFKFPNSHFYANSRFFCHSVFFSFLI